MDTFRTIHGGAFFEALGEDFSHLERIGGIVNADVLDAWYDPSPRVVNSIREHLPWLIKTSPPTHAEGLRKVISTERRVPLDQIIVGAGTSALMFGTIPQLITQDESAVVLDPMYREYFHILTHIIGAQVNRCSLSEPNFEIDVAVLLELSLGAKLVILVNPNSPTGVLAPRGDIERLLQALPSTTILWVDETYIDFVPGSHSVEPLCAEFDNLVVCKSMSKYYSLSGLRVGYLCANFRVVERLVEQTPPWAVGMLAQIAAIEALGDPTYYKAKTAETRILRAELASQLANNVGVYPVPSSANYLLFKLQEPNSMKVVESCRKQGVYLRDCDSLSPRFQGRYIRTAVKTQLENQRIIEALKMATL